MADAFAGDPSIGLKVEVPKVNSLMNGNPLDTAGKFSEIQNRLNTNKLFQQTFAARQEAGQIIASSPDLESAYAALQRNPRVSAFAPEIFNGIRTAEQTETARLGAQQTQALEGTGAFMKAAPGFATSPQAYDKFVESYTANLSPQVRQQVQGVARNISAALFDGLPSDPAAGGKELNKRRAALLASAGGSPEQAALIFGRPTVSDQGGATVFGNTDLTSGGLTPENSIDKTLAPTLVKGPYGEGGAETNTVVSGGTPNALMTQSPPGAAKPGPRSNALGLTGPTQQQSTYNADSGKAIAELQSDMSANAKTLPTTLKRLDIMSDTLGNFQAGGGAEMRAGLGKALQAAKNAGANFITDKLIADVANGSLPDSQVFNAQVKPMVIGELKEAAQGTGRVMKPEVDAFIQLMDTTTDPKAIMQLLNQARFALQVGYDQSQKFLDFKQGIARKDPAFAGLDLSDFYPWYNKNYSRLNLPAHNDKGEALDPRPATDALGTPGSTARPPQSKPDVGSFFK